MAKRTEWENIQILVINSEKAFKTRVKWFTKICKHSAIKQFGLKIKHVTTGHLHFRALTQRKQRKQLTKQRRKIIGHWRRRMVATKPTNLGGGAFKDSKNKPRKPKNEKKLAPVWKIAEMTSGLENSAIQFSSEKLESLHLLLYTISPFYCLLYMDVRYCIIYCYTLYI